jgi:acetate kinase
MAPVFLVLNAGSSSLKFQVFDELEAKAPRVVFKGQFGGLGGAARFAVKDGSGTTLDEATFPAGKEFGHEEALVHLVSWLRAHQSDRELAAIGHRVVHGGETYSGPVLVDETVLSTLDRLVPLAPLHQPHNLEPIRIVRRRLPGLPQVACFDTAFHRGQPEIAQMFALPREIRERGVRRYGFHGLSYDYIVTRLGETEPALARARLIVAHLGNGASLCAIRDGRSVASTMGFTAVDGLMMGTRTGALDPGVLLYLMQERRMDAKAIEDLLYRRSGLLGVSGLSSDMRTLRRSSAPEAAEAIALFVYRIVREAGSLAAALGGVDAVIFTAGIGENDAATRADVAEGCRWLGLELDAARNARGDRCISAPGSRVSAWVMPTDEERMIARYTSDAVGA